MTVQTGTSSNHQDLFDDLRTFVKAADPTGPDWDELDYNGTDRQAVFKAKGLDGTESIHIGLGVVADSGADAFALTGWQFKAYNSLVPLDAQPGNSVIGHMPTWDTTIPYWFIANGRRLIVVTKISTVYTALYLGKILPYGTPGEWPQPYYVGCPFSANTRWSSVSESFRNFWDPGPDGCRILNPSGGWFPVANFQEQSGEQPVAGSNYIWPYAAQFGNSQSSPTDRWRELRQNIDDSVPLRPTIVMGVDPQEDIYGELDGVYACSGFGAASEDIVTIGSDDYLIVQNVFRTSAHDYCAIKLS